MRPTGMVALLALVLTGCTATPPPAPGPAPAPALDATPAPPPAAAAPPRPSGPAVVPDGAGLRLVGIPAVNFVDWAPGGQAALVHAAPSLYRLRLDTRELAPLELGSVQMLGWAGPAAALLVRWSSPAPVVGELSLLTGEWRPLARVPGRVQICQNGAHWLWVHVQSVRQGGAGSREIGPVYRTPAPQPEGARVPVPLAGEPVLARGALLGRLADGSCLLDGLDGRLLLLRPGGAWQTLATAFNLPAVTRDGRGVVWLEQAGACPDCIEVGPGVPFQRLEWWRLDGQRLTADLGAPQVITFLLAPDGEALVIGHRQFQGDAGAISVLGPEGLRPGAPRSPALVPAGWLGSDLLAQPAGPERWNFRSPVFRAADGQQVAEWLASDGNGSLLIHMDGGVRYLTPTGAAHRLSPPEPFLAGGRGIQGLGPYQPQAPYMAVAQEEGALLVRLEAP